MCFLLERVDNAEKVLRIGVASRGQHAMQALARLFQHGREFLKTHRGIDEIPEHRFAGGSSPVRYALIASVKRASRKRGSRWTRAATESLNSRVRAIVSPR